MIVELKSGVTTLKRLLGKLMSSAKAKSTQ